MQPMGPKKKSGAELLAKGSRIARKRLIEEAAEKLKSSAAESVRGTAMRCSAGLSKDSQRMFRQIVKILLVNNCLRDELREPITSAAVNYGDWKAADTAVRKLGSNLTYKTSNSNMAAKPELKIRTDSFNRFTRSLRLFDNHVTIPGGFESAILGGGSGGNGQGFGGGAGDAPWDSPLDPYWRELRGSKDRFFSRAHIWKKYCSKYGRKAVLDRKTNELVNFNPDTDRSIFAEEDSGGIQPYDGRSADEIRAGSADE